MSQLFSLICDRLGKKTIARILTGILFSILTLMAVVFVTKHFALENRLSKVHYENREIIENFDFDKNTFNPKIFSKYVIQNNTVSGSSIIDTNSKLSYKDMCMIVNTNLSYSLGQKIDVTGLIPLEEFEFGETKFVIASDKGNNYKLGLVKFEGDYYIAFISLVGNNVLSARGLRVSDAEDRISGIMSGATAVVNNSKDISTYSYTYECFTLEIVTKYGSIQEIYMYLNCF